MADNIIITCCDCGHKFDADDSLGLYDDGMDELGQISMCPNCGVTNVDANVPPVSLQIIRKEE